MAGRKCRMLGFVGMHHSPPNFDAIAAEIQRLEVQLADNPLWQELKVFEAAGLEAAAGPRLDALRNRLAADPVYSARAKLLDALFLLRGVDLEQSATSAAPSEQNHTEPAQTAAQGKGGRSGKRRKRKRNKRSQPFNREPGHDPVGASGRVGGTAASGSPRFRGGPSLEARLQKLDYETAQLAAVQDVTAPAASRVPGGTPNPRTGARPAIRSHLDVPEADVEIRPASGSKPPSCKADGADSPATPPRLSQHGELKGELEAAIQSLRPAEPADDARARAVSGNAGAGRAPKRHAPDLRASVWASEADIEIVRAPQDRRTQGNEPQS